MGYVFQVAAVFPPTVALAAYKIHTEFGQTGFAVAFADVRWLGDAAGPAKYEETL